MKSIKKYINETDFEIIKVDDFALFYRNIAGDLASGYRLYYDTPSKKTDVTLDAELLLAADDLVMYKPAGDPIIIGSIVAAVIVGAVAVKLLAPTIEAPTNSNRSQSSSTNSLGTRENKVRLGERVDDVFGKVSKFAPSLIQSPHFRYENNTQIENFACAYMKKGLEENHADGDTPLTQIPNAKYNKWDPGSDLSGAPDFSIGGNINRPINSINISEGFQGQELLPPNDLEIDGDLVWSVENNGSVARFTLTNYTQLGVDLRDYYPIGGGVSIIDAEAITSTSVVTLWSSPTTSNDFTEISSMQTLDGSYVISDTQAGYFEIDSSTSGWSTFSSSPLALIYYTTTSVVANRSILESSINDSTWYEDSANTQLVTVTGTITRDPAIGTVFNQAVGPIRCKDFTDLITMNFVANNGFYNIIDGNNSSVSVNIEIELQELDENGQITGNSTTVNVTFSSNSSSLTKQAALTYDLENPYDISQLVVRRTTDRNKGSGVSNVDKVNWEDLYFEDFVSYPDNSDITIIQCQIPSSPTARSVKKRLVNFDLTAYINPYQRGGGFGYEIPSSNFAEVLIACALDKYNGRLTIDNIDAETLLDVQQEMIDYYGTTQAVEVGYNLDSTKLRFQDIYKLFCNAVNARAYAQGGVFKAYADINRESSSKQFTHRNKIPNTDSKTRSYESENDGVELTYRSNLTGEFETVIKHVNGVSSNNRLNIELSGAVNNVQATIRANRELNILKHKRYDYSFEADGIARLTVPGERVDNVDYTRIVKRGDNMNRYEIYSGYVVEQSSSNPLEIELSEQVFFDGPGPHSIRFTDLKGNLLDVISCDIGKSTRHVILSSPPSEPIYTGYSKEKTNYTFSSDSNRNSLPVIIRGTKQKVVNGLKARALTAINYSPLYYQNDKDFFGV